MVINKSLVFLGVGVLLILFNVSFVSAMLAVANLTISDSYVDVDVVATGNRVGGIVGSFTGGLINNTYSKGSVVGVDYTGGLVGYFDALGYYVTNSYSSCDVTGDDYVGGLVGYVAGGSTLSNSFAVGDVSGTTDVGSLVGINDGTLTNLYWYNHSNNPNIGIGTDSNAQSVTLDNSLSYFYNSANEPLASFLVGVWSFSGSSLPTLS